MTALEKARTEVLRAACRYAGAAALLSQTKVKALVRDFADDSRHQLCNSAIAYFAAVCEQPEGQSIANTLGK